MSLTANRDLYNQVSGIGSSFVDNYMKGTQTRIAKEQEKRAKRKEGLSYIKQIVDKGSEIGFLNEAAGNAFFKDKVANDSILKEHQNSLGIKDMDLYFNKEKGGGVYSEQVPLRNVKKGLAKQWGVSEEDANDIFKKKGLSDDSLVGLEKTKTGISINLDSGVKEGASLTENKIFGAMVNLMNNAYSFEEARAAVAKMAKTSGDIQAANLVSTFKEEDFSEKVPNKEMKFTGGKSQTKKIKSLEKNIGRKLTPKERKMAKEIGYN